MKTSFRSLISRIKAVNNHPDRTADVTAVSLIFIIQVVLYWNVLTKDIMMVNGDGILAFASKLFLYRSISSGEIPLWNGYVITGTPFIADVINNALYPFHALALFFSPTLYSNLYFILHTGLAGVFSYLFLKQISKNRWIAFIGGVVFSISIILGARKEHVTVYTSIVWLPLILYFLVKFSVSKKKGFLLLAALAMTMQFFGGNQQHAAYIDILAAFYLLVQLIRSRSSFREILTSYSIWIGSYVLFLAISLIPAIELFTQSARGTAEYFSLLSTRWELLLMMVFPYIFGNHLSQPLGLYGSAEISTELYIGIIPLIYMVYAIRYHFDKWLIRFSLASMIVAFIYSSSANIPFVGSILQKIPILNLFGVQSRTLFIFVFFSIVCFAYGIADLRNPLFFKRLWRHSLLMLIGTIGLAVIVISIVQSPMIDQEARAYYGLTSGVFRASILLAFINFSLVGLLSIISSRTQINYPVGNIIIVLLLVVTIRDVGRFSLPHAVTRFSDLVDTEETETLRKLVNNEPYRILTIYQQFYGGDYYKSGLVDNWSMINNIRNIKGWTEFENLRLNQLLDQSESRDNTSVNRFISDGAILSMLSVRYVLCPLDEKMPSAIPTAPVSEILDKAGPLLIPGNGDLFTEDIPVSLEAKEYYQIEFEVDAPNPEVRLFYIDFYGGPDYDHAEQNRSISLKSGDHLYNVAIYSGDETLPGSGIALRIVSQTDTPLTVKNLKVVKLAPPSPNPDYVLIAQTDRYKIYDNTRAQKLLYIPSNVKSIIDDQDLRLHPDQYPGMDRTSYVQGYKDFQTEGDLEIWSIKNNSVTAHVSSKSTTFVNHAQSYYPGWKAFIDDHSTPIYLVNGVIQGIEIPPGEHVIKFVYDPTSVKIGAFISLISYLGAAIYLYIQFKPKRKIYIEERLPLKI